MFDLDGCKGYLRDCPFLGGRHELRRGWVRLDAVMVSEAGAFLVGGGLGTSFSKMAKRFVTPDVLRLIANLPKPGLFREAVKF